MKSIPITQARAQLREVIEQVQGGEEFVITQHGKPVAMVVSPDRVRIRRAAVAQLREESAQLGEMMAEARRAKRPIRGHLTPGEADAWVAEMHAERDAE
jgi:prevent-host-death family protein